MSVGSTSAAALLKQTLESTVYANGSVSLDNVGTEVSYEFTDPSIEVHLLQSGRYGQSVEIMLAFKDFQLQVGTSTVASAGALSEYPAGVSPGAAMAHCPRRSRWRRRQHLVHRRGLGRVHVLAYEPAARALPVSLPVSSGRVHGLGDTVAPAGIVARPTERCGSLRATAVTPGTVGPSSRLASAASPPLAPTPSTRCRPRLVQSRASMPSQPAPTATCGSPRRRSTASAKSRPETPARSSTSSPSRRGTASLPAWGRPSPRLTPSLPGRQRHLVYRAEFQRHWRYEHLG